MVKQNSKLIFSLIFLLIFGLGAYAQERLTGLSVNPHIQKHRQSFMPKQLSDDSIPALHLPFFEDFSTSFVYPDQSKWLDRDVFVNKDFPFLPPNSGAATFDVLDEFGHVHQDASINAFIADYLSSRPIRLDSIFADSPQALSPADSLYFSFFFQPQGRGNAPETHDSLVLQFGYPTGNMLFERIDSIIVPAASILIIIGQDQINVHDTIWAPEGCDTSLYIISDRIYGWDDDILMPCDSIFVEEYAWNTVWKHQGMTLEEFNSEHHEYAYFKQVMIPLTDTEYFSDRFQFRFYNIATLAYPTAPGDQANVDQWNVDFIYLDKDRTIHEPHHEKLSFSSRAPSFLKRYESMPYKQYRFAPSNAIKESLELKIVNLTSETLNTKYEYHVQQRDGEQSFMYDGGNCNLDPFMEKGFQSCSSGCGKKHACPDVASLFALDTDKDTTSFTIKHYISDASGSAALTDSLVYTQGFYNYFAYDDGTAEVGYNLEPSYAYLAYQFYLSTPDTLKAIHMFFNKTKGQTNNMRFDLLVWNSRNAQPFEVIYTKPNQRPQFSDDLLGFVSYELEQPLPLNGEFYIGLMKKDQGNLNIGFDRVNNSSQYLFLNIDGTWQTSQEEGALMMRPAFGSGKLIGIDEKEHKEVISHYPNPAQGKIYFQIHDESISAQKIKLYDLVGREVLQQNWSSSMDISMLRPGLYLIQVETESSLIYQSKVLIIK